MKRKGETCFILGVIYKLRWQDFAHYWPPSCFKLKFSFSEKATKIWSYHPLDLTFTKQTSNQLGDNSKFLWPSQKSWTLPTPHATGCLISLQIFAPCLFHCNDAESKRFQSTVNLGVSDFFFRQNCNGLKLTCLEEPLSRHNLKWKDCGLQNNLQLLSRYLLEFNAEKYFSYLGL